MDQSDRNDYAAAYRALAKILGRERPKDQPENHLSYALGDLTARIFMGTEFLPPDELLEQVVEVLRAGDQPQQHALAERLKKHAQHLDELKH